MTNKFWTDKDRENVIRTICRGLMDPKALEALPKIASPRHQKENPEDQELFARWYGGGPGGPVYQEK